MASISPLQAFISTNSANKCGCLGVKSTLSFIILEQIDENNKNKRSSTVVAAVGDVSVDGSVYFIAGAAAVALLGTAFPILFSRKDLCPECDGAGFVRKGGAALRANTARKDHAQIVCVRCMVSASLTKSINRPSFVILY